MENIIIFQKNSGVWLLVLGKCFQNIPQSLTVFFGRITNLPPQLSQPVPPPCYSPSPIPTAASATTVLSMKRNSKPNHTVVSMKRTNWSSEENPYENYIKIFKKIRPEQSFCNKISSAIHPPSSHLFSFLLASISHGCRFAPHIRFLGNSDIPIFCVSNGYVPRGIQCADLLVIMLAFDLFGGMGRRNREEDEESRP